MYPRFFNPSDLGQSLKEVSAEVMKAGEKNILSRWFHSAKEVDLFIWTDPDHNILKQQLSFFGQVVEWNVIEGLKTGLIVEEEAQGRPHASGTEIVRFDSKPQKTPVEQAIELLNHITALKERERQALLGNFNDPDAGTNLPAEEFIRRFGSFIQRPDQAPPPAPASVAAGWLAGFKKIASWFKRR